MALYHGTRRGFRGPGGLVLPRSKHGGAGTTAPLNPARKLPKDAADWVYLTESLELAWVYAWHAVGRGTPKVLEVRPMGEGEVERDPEHSGDMDAYRAEAAIVLKVLKEPVMTEAEAREGWLTT